MFSIVFNNLFYLADSDEFYFVEGGVVEGSKDLHQIICQE